MTHATSFCIGALALTLWALRNQGAQSPALVYFGLVLVGLLRLTFTASQPGTAFHSIVVTPVIYLACIAPVSGYLFSRTLFRDDDTHQPFERLVTNGSLLVIGLYTIYYQLLPAAHDYAIRRLIFWTYHPIQTLVLLYFFGRTLQIILRKASDDLIEERRRFRQILAGLISVSVVGASLFFLVSLLHPDLGDAFFFKWSPALAVVLAAVFCPMALLPQGVAAFRGWPRVVDDKNERTADPSSGRFDPSLARLYQLMEEEKLYRRAGLSIGALAERLAMPERDLRALINQNLGHRNFNQFLNSYRLADAQAMLADPAMERVPILTIALDLGFGSAPSFNRIFKAEVGMTPTDFREAALQHQPRPALA